MGYRPMGPGSRIDPHSIETPEGSAVKPPRPFPPPPPVFFKPTQPISPPEFQSHCCKYCLVRFVPDKSGKCSHCGAPWSYLGAPELAVAPTRLILA